MKIATVDLETFWSPTHSSTKMSPIKYCMHPDTDIISCAFKFDNGPTEVVFGEDEVIAYAKKIDWSQYWVVGHNMSGFDAMILAWRMGVKPMLWGCTLAMARPIHAKDVGLSLGKLVEHYGLGKKDQSALIATKGKRLADFTPAEIEEMRTYNADDVDQCYALLKKLIPQMRKDEVKLIDMTIRMLVEPRFDADIDLLANTYTEETERKEQVLRELGALIYNDVPTRAAMKTIDDFDPSDEEQVKTMLMSAAKFRKLLESLGVTVPMKVSPTTGKEIPALAKSDEEFLALQENENEMVAAAAAARLDAKSTLLHTRINAFIDAAEAHPKKKVPIPLKYYGADTTGRWSGWGYNPQNLPRVNPYEPKPSDALRKSLRAPEGHKVVVADLSGIELRVNHFLWKVPASMELYNADPAEADLYKDFASKLYDVPFDEVSKEQRQVGKVAHLGLGFGAGHRTFQKVARLMAGIEMDLDEAKEVVDRWRNEYIEIVRGWRTCHNALPTIMRGATGAAVDPWGMVVPVPEGLKTPKGIIRYPDLRTEHNEDDGRMEFIYGQGRRKARIYAGKIDENCLAEGTQVLTDSGWKAIETVTRQDLVHDGVEFVRHGGNIFKSIQDTIIVDGVYMTADHEVLTDDGWKEASQVQRPYRPEVRRTDRLEALLQQRQVLGLDLRVPMRHKSGEAGGRRDERGKTGGSAELRVPNQGFDRHEKCDTRHVETSSIRRVAEHVGPLLATIAPRMEKLRRARHQCVCTMAELVRGVLGGYGRWLPAGVGFGQEGQQWPLQPRELSVGYSPNKHAQPTERCREGHTLAFQETRRKSVDTVLPSQTGATFGSSSGQKESNARKVYDILNAGPRHRFVVLGGNGPFIVHNCVQHLARQVIADNAIQVQKETGYSPALTVHDELVYVTPENEAETLLDKVQSIMRTPPEWWPELVTWSEGDIADTYGDAK